MESGDFYDGEVNTLASYGKTLEAEHAFEIYLSLGAKRDVGTVAELTGKSIRTIQQYKKMFGWEERISDYINNFGEFTPNSGGEINGPGIGGIENNGRENQITDFQAFQLMCGKRPEQVFDDKDLTPQELISKYSPPGTLGAMTKNEYRLLLGSLIRDFAERFRNGEVKINTIYEFERVVKLDLLLMGETAPINSSGSITINNNNVEYSVQVEQVLKENPAAQDLLAEMWRSYNAPTPIFKDDISRNINDGMGKLKELVNNTPNQSPLTTKLSEEPE